MLRSIFTALFVLSVSSPSAGETAAKAGRIKHDVELTVERHVPGVYMDDIILKLANNTEQSWERPIARCVLFDQDGRALDVATAWFDPIAAVDVGYHKLITMAKGIHRFSCKAGDLSPPQ